MPPTRTRHVPANNNKCSTSLPGSSTLFASTISSSLKSTKQVVPVAGKTRPTKPSVSYLKTKANFDRTKLNRPKRVSISSSLDDPTIRECDDGKLTQWNRMQMHKAFGVFDSNETMSKAKSCLTLNKFELFPPWQSTNGSSNDETTSQQNIEETQKLQQNVETDPQTPNDPYLSKSKSMSSLYSPRTVSPLEPRTPVESDLNRVADELVSTLCTNYPSAEPNQLLAPVQTNNNEDDVDVTSLIRTLLNLMNYSANQTACSGRSRRKLSGLSASQRTTRSITPSTNTTSEVFKQDSASTKNNDHKVNLLEHRLSTETSDCEVEFTTNSTNSASKPSKSIQPQQTMVRYGVKRKYTHRKRNDHTTCSSWSTSDTDTSRPIPVKSRAYVSINDCDSQLTESISYRISSMKTESSISRESHSVNRPDESDLQLVPLNNQQTRVRYRLHGHNSAHRHRSHRRHRSKRLRLGSSNASARSQGTLSPTGTSGTGTTLSSASVKSRRRSSIQQLCDQITRRLSNFSIKSYPTNLRSSSTKSDEVKQRNFTAPAALEAELPRPMNNTPIETIQENVTNKKDLEERDHQKGVLPEKTKSKQQTAILSDAQQIDDNHEDRFESLLRHNSFLYADTVQEEVEKQPSLLANARAQAVRKRKKLVASKKRTSLAPSIAQSLLSAPIRSFINQTTSSASLMQEINEHEGGVNCLELSEDRSLLVSGGEDGVVRMWSTFSTPCECIGILTGHTGYITCVNVYRYLVVSGSADKTLRIWSIETSNCLAVLRGHDAFINKCTCFGPVLLSGSFDASARVWSLANKLTIARYAINADGISKFNQEEEEDEDEDDLTVLQDGSDEGFNFNQAEQELKKLIRKKRGLMRAQADIVTHHQVDTDFGQCLHVLKVGCIFFEFAKMF